jgi:hypothetical protein
MVLVMQLIILQLSVLLFYLPLLDPKNLLKHRKRLQYKVKLNLRIHVDHIN